MRHITSSPRQVIHFAVSFLAILSLIIPDFGVAAAQAPINSAATVSTQLNSDPIPATALESRAFTRPKPAEGGQAFSIVADNSPTTLKPAQPAPGNLFTNNSFDADISGWQATAGTWAWQATQAGYTGVAFSSGPTGNRILSQTVSLQAGVYQVEFDAYAYVYAFGGEHAESTILVNGVSIVSPPYFGDGIPAMWRHHVATFTASYSGQYTISFSVLNEGALGGPLTPRAFWLDNMSLTQIALYPLPSSQAFATNECPFCNNGSKVYTAGQGINIYSGNYNYQQADGQVIGLGGALSFERSYNSLAAGAPGYLAYNDVMGQGWTHNYNVRLMINPASEPTKVILIAPRGSQLRFSETSPGVYAPDAAVLASLTRTGTSPNYVYDVLTNSQYKYTFNNSGKLTKITDPQGHITTLTYNASGQLTQIKDASATRYFNLTYTSGRITKVTDNAAHSATYTYNTTTGDLTGVTDMSGQVWTYQYQTGTHFLTKVLLKTGTSTTQTVVQTVFNTSGQATDQYDGAGKRIASVNYAPPNATQRVVTTDAEDGTAVTTTVTFNGNVPVAVDGPGASDSQTTFTGQGINLGVVTDPNGNTTNLEWSPNGNNLTKVTDPYNKATTFTYDSLNNLKQATDALGHTTVYTYTNSLLTSFADPLGNTTVYTYTTTAPIGLLFEQRDPLGIVTRYTYTAQGQVATVTRNYVNGVYDATKPYEDLKTTYTYDTAGRVLTITDNQTTRVTRNVYNTLGQLTSATENYLAGQVQNYQNLYNLITTYTYDTAGRVYKVKDTLNNTAWTCYDPSVAGRVIRTVANAVGTGATPATDPCNATNYVPSASADKDRITTYTYDDNGLLIATKDPSGVVTRTYYDSLNRPVVVVTNMTQPVTTPLASLAAYDPNFPDQNVRAQTFYDNAGNVIKTIDNAGQVSYNCYDKLNRVVKTIQNPTVADPCASYTASPDADKDIVEQTVYDDVGNIIATIDPAGVITRTYYDALNQPEIVIQNLVGQAITVPTPPTFNSAFPDRNIGAQTFYNAAGRVYKQLDLTTGRSNWTCYDGLGQATKQIVNAVGASPCATGYVPSTQADQDVITQFTYDAAGRQIAVTAPDVPVGKITRTYYDLAGRRTAVTVNLVGQAITVATPPAYSATYPDRNLTTKFTYDALGRVTKTTVASGVTGKQRDDWTCYDALGRVVKAIQGPTSATPCSAYTPSATLFDRDLIQSTTYDAKGDAIGQTDPLNVITRIYYDALHRPTVTAQNLIGQAVTVTTPPTFDPAFPDRNVKQQTRYDATGRPFETIDNAGMVVHTDYDLLGRPVAETVNYVAGGPVDNVTNLKTQTVYDKRGNVIRKVDAKNVVTAYEYDALNRLTAVVENYRPGVTPNQEINVRTEYTYDSHGNRLTIKNAKSQITNFQYDALDRLLTETDPLLNQTSRQYDKVGQQTSTKDAYNVTNATYAYDGARRLTGITYPAGTPNVTFVYDGAGNRTSLNTVGVGTATNYVADLLRRVTQVTDPFSKVVKYTYDRLGNRKSLTYPGITTPVNYAYDALNRVKTVTDWNALATTYTYNAAGQLATTALPNGVATSYGYDAAHRLTGMTHTIGADTLASFQYTYDAVGNRTQVIETTQPIPTPDPVAKGYWKLENNLIDSSGNSNNGVGTGTYGPGKVGQALTRDGIQSEIGVPNINGSLNMTTTLSIETWVNISDYNPGYRHIFDKVNEYGLSIIDGRPGMHIAANWWQPTTFPQLSLNAWHYIVATWNGSQRALYIDGQQVASIDWSGTICCGGGAAGFGGGVGGFYKFKGSLDEVRVMNRALSASEVWANCVAAGGSCGADPSTQTIQGYWQFENNLNDSSGKGNHGTGTGTYGPGQVGQGLTRSGAQSPIPITNNANSLNLSAAITLEAWVNISDYNPGYRHIIDKMGGYALSIGDGRPRFFGAGGWWEPTNFPQLSLNAWHYIVATYNGAQKALYIDGQVVAAVSQSGSIPTGAGIAIGGAGDGTNNYLFKGTLDNVRVRNGALTDSQVLAIYNSGGTLSALSANSGGGADAPTGADTPTESGLRILTPPPATQVGVPTSAAPSFSLPATSGPKSQPSDTPTLIPSDTPTLDASAASSPTATSAPTETPTPDVSVLIVPTDTPTFDANATALITETAAATTMAEIASATATATATETASATATPTATATETASATATATATATAIAAEDFSTPTAAAATASAALTPTGISPNSDSGQTAPDSSLSIAPPLGSESILAAAQSTSVTITYVYDPLYRLKQANYSDGRSFAYTYDAVGNRLSQTVCVSVGNCVTTNYTYDAANRLATINGVAQTWDKNGNLTQDNTGATYTYDSANRLKTLTQGTTTSSYVYNGLGDRLQQTVSGVTTTYTLDLNAGLTQVLADGTNTYLYGAGRIAQNSTANGKQYFLGDALGSVRQLVSANGAVTLTRSYEPYGSVLTSAASTGVSTAYSFVGEWDDTSGLLHLRARYYASSQGRFISRDSWPGDANQPMSYNGWLYAYARPIVFADPNGRIPCSQLPSGDQIEYCNTITVSQPPDVRDYDEKTPPPNITFIGAPLSPPKFIEYRNSGNEAVTPPGTDQSQFIDEAGEPTWPIDTTDDQIVHTGLCGQGSVTAILKLSDPNISLNEVTDKFLEIFPDEPPDYTYLGQLARLINKKYGAQFYAWSDGGVTNQFLGVNDWGGYRVLPTRLRSWLGQSTYVIAGIGINGNSGELRNGLSENFSAPGNTLHWAVITGVSNEWYRTANGSNDTSPWKWVRIYNPFDNGTEYYWWADFKSSWDDWGGYMLRVDTKSIDDSCSSRPAC
jgi:RHS repeat-associated protein